MIRAITTSHPPSVRASSPRVTRKACDALTHLDTAMPLWIQIWFCVPLWVAVALCVALAKALVSTSSERRTLWWRWAIVFAVFLATSLLWANPSQMIFRSGPFSGHVKDADTGKAVPVALLAFHWQGALNSQSSHAAWTLSGEDGSYYLGWQGIANWRIGAWPGPDSVYVQAPGYATAQFFLDDIERDPNGDHDASAKSASLHDGEIRMHRLRPNTKFNLIRYGIPFGLPAGDERQQVAKRFHEELFKRLCPQSSRPPEWESTDVAFSQLLSISGVLYGSRLQLMEADRELQYITSENMPSALDANRTAELCSRFQQAKGE